MASLFVFHKAVFGPGFVYESLCISSVVLIILFTKVALDLQMPVISCVQATNVPDILHVGD